MDKKITLDRLQESIAAGVLPKEIGDRLQEFFLSFHAAIASNRSLSDPSSALEVLCQFLELVCEEIRAPFHFEPYHQAIREPIDYYRFGLELIRPLIDFERSRALNLKHVETMNEQLQNQDNVILFANHQTEPDPQIISLMLEDTYPAFAEKMIFVAGHRVISDPLAIPFSKGRNLLCIFSKKHIDTPPEQRENKLLHNKRTMSRMAELLLEGGKCIYVAPSGGRDRINAEGVIEVAPFDPQSIELFYLLAKKSARPTHFYPLALSTYEVLPPPSSVEKTLGERRLAQCSPVQISFGSEIDMPALMDENGTDKVQKRKTRADAIWRIVNEDFHAFQRISSRQEEEEKGL